MDVGFLTESNGSPSSMRVIALMCVTAAIAIGIYIVYANVQSDNSMVVFFSLLGAGIGGKIGQKALEEKKKEV